MEYKVLSICYVCFVIESDNGQDYWQLLHQTVHVSVC